MTAGVVVDSSVAIKWFVIEPYSAQALRILGDYQKNALTLLAPEFIYAEMGNIVRKHHSRRGLSAANAQAILNGFRALTIGVTLTAGLVSDAYHLAVAHGRTVYDCLYLALSLREACPFVTAPTRS